MAEPSPTGNGLTIVVNATAGPRSHSAMLDVIEDALPDAVLRVVDDVEDLRAAFADAAAEGVALGVIGGDGTVGLAAEAAHDARIPLAVFPGGTLNHFARDVGVDQVMDAINAVKTGQIVDIDVGTIDGRLFLNSASFGGYSQFVEAREALESRIGKWPAVAIALVRMLVSGAPHEVTIEGETMSIWMIFVGNCAYDPPGFAPATRTQLDDGVLDVRIVDGSQPRARLRLIVAVLLGRLADSPVYRRELVERLDVKTTRKTDILAADGETFSGSGSFTVEKPAVRLSVFAPDHGDDLERDVD